MFTSIKSRLISFFLVVALMFSLMCASAIPANAASDISSPGGNGESKVVTTVDPSIFSVTVPYVLPITVDANQNVSTADNAQIINNSNGPIIVSSAEITAKNGWELVDSSTDFQAVPVNSKQLTLSVMGEPVDVSGSVDTILFSSINGNSSLNINYDADAAVQGDALSNQNVADVLFTVEWDSYELSGDVVSKTALSTFASSNNLKTFQRTTENLNIDDVLADDRMVKIDNAPVVASGKSRTAIASGAAAETDPVVYAWADDEGNGYWWTNADKVYLPADCSGMFKNSTLTELDLSNFDTSNVTNMYQMFYGCSKLTLLDLSSFDTSNVTNMSYMFNYCSKLSSLNLSGFDTNNVINMSYMFANCSSIGTLDLSSFNTSNVTDMSGMFSWCSNLKSLNISSFNTSNVTSMYAMFSWTYVSSLDLLNFETSDVTNISCMFAGCKNLKILDLSSFDTSNVTTMESMFNHCESITSLDLSSFDTGNVKTMHGMFSNCYQLKAVDLSSFDTGNVTDMMQMFYYCYNLDTFDLSKFDTGNVTAVSGMFEKCYSINSLDLSSFNTNKVKQMDKMFQYCTSLTTIYVSDYFSTKSIAGTSYGSNMFTYCNNLVGQNGTTYNSSYTNNTYARIDTPETPGYFTYKAKTAA